MTGLITADTAAHAASFPARRVNNATAVASPPAGSASGNRFVSYGGLQTSPAFSSLEAGLTYDQALSWLKQPNTLATIERISIEYDPDDWRALAQARFYLRNGQTWSVTLPHNEEPFIQAIQQAGVPFAYANHHPSRLEAVRHVASHTVKDALLPLLVFSATTLAGLGLYNKAQGWMASRKLGQLLRQAWKNYPDHVAKRLPDVVTHLPANAQRLIQQFKQGSTHFILAEGPPGTGKTHLLDSLAADVAKNAQALVLEIGGDMGDVRDMLYRLYSGDAVQSRMALKALRKLINQPEIRQLILRVDEMEDVADELQPLITKGMGNGQTTDLPQLRVLATCNRLPVLTDAVKNRVNRGRLFLDYPNAPATAHRLSRLLTPLTQGIAQNDIKAALLPVVQQNPGYSMRSLQDAIAAVERQGNKGNKGPGAASPSVLAQRLATVLSDMPLDDTEMAGVLRHGLLASLPATTSPAVRAFVNRHAVEATEQAVRGLDTQLNLNGQSFYQLVKAALKQHNQPTPVDPDDLVVTIQQLGRLLRTQAASLLNQTYTNPGLK